MIAEAQSAPKKDAQKIYLNAAYNMGLYNNKLKDPQYVTKNYTVPNYGVFKIK